MNKRFKSAPTYKLWPTTVIDNAFKWAIKKEISKQINIYVIFMKCQVLNTLKRHLTTVYFPIDNETIVKSKLLELTTTFIYLPGDPLAVQLKVTFSYSCMITSLLDGSSRISGETGGRKSTKWSYKKFFFLVLTDDI